MSHRLLLKPPFPRDETINSLVDRCAAMSMGVSLRLECIKSLSRAKVPLDTVPSGIQQFCKAFHYVYGSEDRILAEHTLFDFYACGLEASRVGEFRTRLLEIPIGPVRPSRLPVLCMPAEHECFHCPACDEYNQKNRGFVFRYRQHNAPYVHICPWHRTVLTSQSKRLYEARCRQSESGDATNMYEYSIRMAECIESSFACSPYQRDEVLRQLKESGWVSEDGRCAASCIADTFRKKFNGFFSDERLNHLCSKDDCIHAALRAMSRSDRSLHPVWCVLLRWFANEVERNRCLDRITSKASVPRTMLSKELIESALRAEGSARKAARALNINVTSLITHALRYGLQISLRPKTLHERQKDEIRQCVQNGMALPLVAARCSVSLSTVYRVASAYCPSFLKLHREERLLAQIESARVSWLEALQLDKQSTVSDLKRKHLAIWTLLYRHDREWLAEHTEKRRHEKRHRIKRPSPNLVKIAFNAVADAQAECDSKDITPIRKSKYRLQAMTGLSDYVLTRYLCEESHETAQLQGESHESFVTRRLQWAIDQDGCGTPLRGWRLAKKANLRTSSVALISPESLGAIQSSGAVEVHGCSHRFFSELPVEAPHHEA